MPENVGIIFDRSISEQITLLHRASEHQSIFQNLLLHADDRWKCIVDRHRAIERRLIEEIEENVEANDRHIYKKNALFLMRSKLRNEIKKIRIFFNDVLRWIQKSKRLDKLCSNHPSDTDGDGLYYYYVIHAILRRFFDNEFRLNNYFLKLSDNLGSFYWESHEYGQNYVFSALPLTEKNQNTQRLYGMEIVEDIKSTLSEMHRLHNKVYDSLDLNRISQYLEQY